MQVATNEITNNFCLIEFAGLILSFKDKRKETLISAQFVYILLSHTVVLYSVSINDRVLIPLCVCVRACVCVCVCVCVCNIIIQK